MLSANDQKAPLAETKSTAYEDLGAMNLRTLVVVGS